jgi:hypothetical protein
VTLRSAALAALVLAAGCAAPVPPPPAAVPAPIPAPTPADPLYAGAIFVEGALEQGGWLRGTVPPGTARLMLGAARVPFDAEGRFFAGIDRDAPATLRITGTSGRGQVIVRDLTVAPRAWLIERVNVPLRGSVPSETFMRVRRPELARIEAARSRNSESAGWLQPFQWPVKGRISGRFGSQRIYQGVPGAYHSGLDIAPGAGVPYVAPADGVVTLAASKPFSLEGNLLIIDHGMGLNSAFLHSSRISVKEGDRVRQGQLLGYVGATGRASGPHLHWSLKWQDARLDPLLFLPAQ